MFNAFLARLDKNFSLFWQIIFFLPLPRSETPTTHLIRFGRTLITLVNVYVDLVVFTRITGTSYTGSVDIGVNTI